MKHWDRLDTYYQIRRSIKNLNENEVDYCGMCFKPTCNHNLERVNYEDARAELTWWGEIALAEYKGNYLPVGEVDVVPAWPKPQPYKNEFDLERYTVFPKIKGGIFGVIVNHAENLGYTADLQLAPEISAIANKFGKGAYWGYLYEGEFYLVRVWRERWINLQRLKSMPKQDVTGYTIPNFNVDFEIEGYCFMPKAKDNFSFQTKYFEL